MSSLLRNIEQFSRKFHFPLTARCFSKLFTNGGKTRSLSPVYMRYHGLSKASESWGKTYNEISHTLDNNWIIFQVGGLWFYFSMPHLSNFDQWPYPKSRTRVSFAFYLQFYYELVYKHRFHRWSLLFLHMRNRYKKFFSSRCFNSPFFTKRDKEF